jgi:translation elongation factor P/translation initiation factor 5A
MAEVGILRRGDVVLLEGEPFRIDSIQSVVISRHSHTKIKMDLTGMFSGTKKILSLSPHKTMEKVDIKRKHGQLIAKISENVWQIMDMMDYTIYEAHVPKDLMERMREGDELTYIEYGGRVQVLEVRK